MKVPVRNLLLAMMLGATTTASADDGLFYNKTFLGYTESHTSIARPDGSSQNYPIRYLNLQVNELAPRGYMDINGDGLLTGLLYGLVNFRQIRQDQSTWTGRSLFQNYTHDMSFLRVSRGAVAPLIIGAAGLGLTTEVGLFGEQPEEYRNLFFGLGVQATYGFMIGQFLRQQTITSFEPMLTMFDREGNFLDGYTVRIEHRISLIINRDSEINIVPGYQLRHASFAHTNGAITGNTFYIRLGFNVSGI